jgi:hypothetical protein
MFADPLNLVRSLTDITQLREDVVLAQFDHVYNQWSAKRTHLIVDVSVMDSGDIPVTVCGMHAIRYADIAEYPLCDDCLKAAS